MRLDNVKVGDTVIRMISGTVPQSMIVTKVTDTLIVCNLWTFDKKTGIEVDEILGWGPQFGITGSYLLQEDA